MSRPAILHRQKARRIGVVEIDKLATVIAPRRRVALFLLEHDAAGVREDEQRVVFALVVVACVDEVLFALCVREEGTVRFLFCFVFLGFEKEKKRKIGLGWLGWLGWGRRGDERMTWIERERESNIRERGGEKK